MEIVKSISIDNLINQRAAFQDKLAQAVSLHGSSTPVASLVQTG